jgi:flagellar hook-associated protein 1 FlgK
VGGGNDLASLLGQVQSAFTTLLQDPSNGTQQQAVIGAAQRLASGLNQQSTAVQAARQTAQDSIVSGVASLNADLARIGTLNLQIIGLRASGQSTADLEAQRDAALQDAGSLVSLRRLDQPDGSVLVTTATGTVLPTDPRMGLSTANATMGPANATPPAITLGGTDITAQLTGGTLGANIALRDTVLPSMQAGLDELAHTLATRFDDQGLRLFTDPAGNVPVSGTPTQTNYLGFAGTIQVNPAVLANPASVRDGTQAVAGSATGASAFTPNPTGGPAGFTTLIQRVLSYALGSEAQAGVPQAMPAATGLGAAGTLSADLGTDPGLPAITAALAADHASQTGSASDQATAAATVQATITNALTAKTGVSIDTEMSSMIALQNAYGANARLISAVQAMFSAILQATS